MEAKQWGFPYGDVLAHVDVPPGHARNQFIVIGDELNPVAYVPAIHPEAEKIARLIMAAPKMLTALEIAWHWQNSGLADEDAVLDIMALAIAEATGKEAGSV